MSREQREDDRGESGAEVGRRGLELQRPWSELLLTGVKTAATRGYALPAALVGVPLLVIETEPVVPGQSGLGDVVQAGTEGARLTGEVTFSESSYILTRRSHAP